MSQSSESRIEVKVGALIIVCLALLVGFLFLLGDWRFGEDSTVIVDWETSASLKVGAPVKVAGLEAGRVEEITFMGGAVDADVGRPVFVRVKLSVKPEMRNALKRDARFHITTQGLLGEKYVEIDPGLSADDLGSKPVVGQPPMRLEKMAAKVEDLLTTVNSLVVDNADAIGGTIQDVRSAVQTAKLTVEEARAFVGEARGSLKVLESKGGRALDSADVALKEFTPGIGKTGDQIGVVTDRAAAVAVKVDRALGDGTELRGIVTDTRATVRDTRAVVARVGGRVDSIAAKAESAIGTADALMAESRSEIKLALKQVNAVLADTKAVSRKIRAGEGTVGALLSDRELFDDAREIMKDLKRHPWKFLWKE
ncbi:MAG: phospholipid/cholesterol/gamma-HCH transport system substrate-binding protein [Myxococcota bacterium]